jgi:uncharacterized PurR-regulated membrane protein YhhQ (DUF165 family)
VSRRIPGLLALIVYILSIPTANWVFQQFGNVPIVAGLAAPSAALVVGFTFLARDYVHRDLGVSVVLGAIALGTALSFFISPSLALASGAAFLFSELADLFVFQRLRDRGFSRAVTASNVVSAIVDSIIFLWLAFHSLDHLAGLLAAKVAITVVWLAMRELARDERAATRWKTYGLVMSQRAQ